MLVTGQKYYLEGLLKENAGGDYLQAAVKLSSDPANPDTLAPIPGDWLSTAANADTAGTITILQQPAGRVFINHRVGHDHCGARACVQDRSYN